MQRIPIDYVQPSMVLAATIKDKNGNIVLLKGAALTEKQIAIIKSRDIGAVIVEGRPLPRGNGRTKELSNEIDRRFSTAGSHPVMEKIKDVIKGMIP